MSARLINGNNRCWKWLGVILQESEGSLVRNVRHTPATAAALMFWEMMRTALGLSVHFHSGPLSRLLPYCFPPLFRQTPPLGSGSQLTRGLDRNMSEYGYEGKSPACLSPQRGFSGGTVTWFPIYPVTWLRMPFGFVLWTTLPSTDNNNNISTNNN